MSRAGAREAGVALPLALFAAAVCAVPILDPDTWWHLAAGRAILAAWAVPRVDAWSWTLRGARWVDFEWLAQAAIELARRAGGFEALVWLKAAACSAAALAVYAAARREGSGRPGGLLAALLALSAVRVRAQVRPEVVSLLLTPFFLLAARERLRRPLPLWPLVPLAALWANAHGGWPLGPAMLLLSAAGESWRARSTRSPAVADIAGTGLLCAAVSLLNPYGASLHAALLLHLLRPPASAGVEEWLSEGLRYFPAFWLLLAGYAARLAADALRRRRAALAWACVLTPLALLGLSGARFAVLFCLTAPVYVLSGVEGLPHGRTLAAGLAAACAALALGMAPALYARDWRRPVLWDRTPRAAVDFLEREGLQGTLFNDYGFGGYVDWRTRGARPVYYDGRYLFQDLLAEAQEAAADPASFADLLVRRGVTYALVPFPKRAVPGPDGLPRSPWALRFPRQAWALVWFDDAALVYVRRLPRYADLIARREYRFADPADPDYVLAQLRRGAWARPEVDAELARRRSEGPCAAAAALASLVAGERTHG